MASAHGASTVVVFGSVARGEAGPDSDIDIWVEFDHRRNDPASLDRLAAELERLLGFGVDVGCSLTMGGGAMASVARDGKSL
jgi:predicted nucleotidyltransferase